MSVKSVLIYEIDDVMRKGELLEILVTGVPLFKYVAPETRKIKITIELREVQESP